MVIALHFVKQVLKFVAAVLLAKSSLGISFNSSQLKKQLLKSVAAVFFSKRFPGIVVKFSQILNALLKDEQFILSNDVSRLTSLFGL